MNQSESYQLKPGSSEDLQLKINMLAERLDQLEAEMTALREMMNE